MSACAVPDCACRHRHPGRNSFFSIPALAVIQQGDLSIFGYVETREAGRWGEGSSGHGIPTFTTGGGLDTIDVGRPTLKKGGSFAFDRWDLVEARQILTLRTRTTTSLRTTSCWDASDTVDSEDADFFAYYRTWYDALKGRSRGKGRVEPFEDYSNASISTRSPGAILPRRSA